jgi:hypothetical protein
MNISLVCGYGIPQDIHQDQNYLTYLRIVFNTIYAQAANEEAVIIPCGGPTSCVPPYEGTEAHAIGDYLRSLMQREEVVTATKDWRILEEDRSLSTLENLVFAQQLIQSHKLQGQVAIFCEATRQERVHVVASKIFDSSVVVEAIDFDHSKNRYLNPDMLHKKEAAETEQSFWVLEDPERLKAHHAFFEQKLAFLRQKQQEGLSHVDAVAEWFRVAPALLATTMPTSPSSKEK